MNLPPSINHKRWIIIGVVSLFFAILLGAFGAHGLREILSTATIESFKTGVTYQFYHGISLLGLIALKSYLHIRYLKYGLYLLLSGMIFFSGSIYAITLYRILNSSEQAPQGLWTTFMFFLTPIGGLLFLLAWGFVFFSALKKR